MIQHSPALRVADNTGARELLCIRVWPADATCARRGRRDRGVGQAGGAGRLRQEGRSRASAVIVRTAKEYGRADGSHIRFDDNAAVILTAGNNPTRHPHLWPGGPRAAREELHEDHLAGARSPVRAYSIHTWGGSPPAHSRAISAP